MLSYSNFFLLDYYYVHNSFVFLVFFFLRSSPADAQTIAKIRTSRRNQEDFLAWHPDRRGIFTVRSAYNLGLERHMQEQNVGASSNHPDGSRPEWNIQWRCQVPPKVCIFAWKACRDALATQVNMQRRKMVIHGTCTICGKEEEDTFHALVTCPHAQGLWQAMRSCWDLPGDAQVQRTDLIGCYFSFPN